MILDEHAQMRAPRRILFATCLVLVSAFLLQGHTVARAIASAALYTPLVLNAIVDWKTSRLIVALTNIAIGVVIAACLWLALTGNPQRACTAALVGSAVGGGVALASRLSAGRLVGMGDARLLFTLAPWHMLDSASALVGWLVLACFSHGVLVIILRLCGDRRRSHPFGPSLIFTSILCSLLAVLRQ